MDEHREQREMTGGIAIKREINFNTIAIIVGFLSTLTAIVWSYANLTNKQENFGEFITDQKATNARFDERFQSQGKLLADLPLMGVRVVTLETVQEKTDERIGRVTESYSNQFADIRLQLSTIGTQVALVKQSLDRIEAWREPDRSGVARQR